MHCKQKYGLGCDDDMNAHVGTRDVTVWATDKHKILPESLQRVYGEDTLSHSVVFMWHRRFLLGRDSLEDDVRSDRPEVVGTERRIQGIATLVHANRSQSVDDLAAAVEVSHDTW